MKKNEQGHTVLNVFVTPLTGTRKQAMDRYYPGDPGEGPWEFQEDQSYSDLGEQQWMGITATRDEVDIIQKVLRGEELTEEEKTFAQRLSGLISAAWMSYEQSLSDVA